MRVMVTGGTGFVGGHVVAALVHAGHEPRLLVRDEEKLARAMALHGLENRSISHVVGDILDPRSVVDALSGCEACVHAAAFSSLNAEEMPKALNVNAPGARIVLDAAIAAGCDPVVHVSTMSVVFPPSGDRLSAYDPVRGSGSPYDTSKAEADLHARAMQENGSPVVIVYPSGVAGPTDVGTNYVEGMLAQILAADFVMTADSGGLLLVDVRDVATSVAALIVPGLGPRRYMMCGHHMGWDTFADIVQTVTGVERRRMHMTRAALEQNLDPAAVDIMLGSVPGDEDALVRDTGVVWRPFSETLRDTIAWMGTRRQLALSQVP